jgi:putative Mg2+ transporter-C (MgtC) family protein
MSLAMSAAEAGHLVVAVGLTYALGFERDLRGAPTGDRVFALIGAGAGVVGIISVHGAPNALAGAITGIGFIGGGLLFRQSIGSSQILTGITTAAAIFAAAAIGAAAGEGYLLIATVATLLALLVLEIRHIKVLSFLDGHHWAHRFSSDVDPTDPHLPVTGVLPGGTHLKLVKQGGRRGGHLTDGPLERLGVMPGRGPESADLAHVLQGGGPDVLVGDPLGVRRAQGLDAAAHVLTLCHN